MGSYTRQKTKVDPVEEEIDQLKATLSKCAQKHCEANENAVNSAEALARAARDSRNAVGASRRDKNTRSDAVEGYADLTSRFAALRKH